MADESDTSTEYLRRLGTAARRRRRITFGYHAEDGSRSERSVEPYRQIIHQHRWYLLGWDIRRDAWRTFRFDRMSDLDVTGKPFEPRDVPGTAAVHLENSQQRPRHHVSMVFDAPLATIGSRLMSQEAAFEDLGADRCRAILWTDSFAWLSAIILFIGIDFEVEEPEEFRTHCRELRDRLDRAVRVDADAPPR